MTDLVTMIQAASASPLVGIGVSLLAAYWAAEWFSSK